MKAYQHCINGASVTSSSGATFETVNPYTGEAWATLAKDDSSDVDAAVSAANAAFEGWAAVKPTARGRFLLKLADLIERDSERLGEIEVCDDSKLIAEMAEQTAYMAQWYRYYGGLADKIQGAVLPTDKEGIFNFTRYEPVGVVGIITPWNSPLLLLAWKLAPGRWRRDARS